jgi:hypothetical protein
MLQENLLLKTWEERVQCVCRDRADPGVPEAPLNVRLHERAFRLETAIARTNFLL